MTTTRTLLVADDSRTVQRIVEMAGAENDLRVVSVADGELAIAQIDAQHPDIILADISMPKRSGYDVAAFVKGRPDLAHIPVLLMAGMFEATDEDRARSLGCAEVLAKPLKPQHLVERVKHWLEAPVAPPLDSTGPPDVHPEGGSVASPLPPTDPTEDYFSRLDAAFKSLGPLGARHEGHSAGSGAAAGAETVPTLQELLNRLPQETRTRLTPSPPPEGDSASALDASVLDAIANRLLEQLARREDVLDAIARRLAERNANSVR